MIKIVDYGLGNILAFQNVFKRLNLPAGIAKTAADLAGATKLVLPGVGAFDQAMRLLDESGMREALDDCVMARGVPVLGVCVGMQILADSSEEGQAAGLGWIRGQVKGFRSLPDDDLLIPHMGWNDVTPATESGLFGQLGSAARFYFLHSFYFECAERQHVAGVTSYGLDFASAVHRDNVYGVQFHPEKSHLFGARLLQGFAAL
jgi:imidazole glycerol-phosphate synthase subunit HisH